VIDLNIRNLERIIKGQGWLSTFLFSKRQEIVPAIFEYGIVFAPFVIILVSLDFADSQKVK
jgi:hypothetical protein